MATKSIEKTPATETVPVQKTPAFPTLFDPWGEFERMRKVMDDMMNVFFRPEGIRPRLLEEARQTWRPALNMFRHEGNLIIEAAMPGLKKDDIQVNLTGDTLTLHGHRKSEKKVEEEHYFCSEMREGQFTSSIRLPMDVVADQVKAEYKDGILKLTLPMVEPDKHKTTNVKIQ